jgi:hypothetical protein
MMLDMAEEGSPLLTEIHNVVTADGTIVHDDVPSPKGYCIPLEICKQ